MNVFSAKPPAPPTDTACSAKRGPSSPLSSVSSSPPSKTRASGSTTSVPSSSMTISMSFGTQASPVVASAATAARSPLDLSHTTTADLHTPASPLAATTTTTTATFKTEDCPKLRKAVEEGEEEMTDGSPTDQRPPTLAAGEGGVVSLPASPCSPASSRGSVAAAEQPLKKGPEDQTTDHRRPRLNSISTATSPLTAETTAGQVGRTASPIAAAQKPTPKPDDVSSQLQVLVDFLRSVAAGRAEGGNADDGSAAPKIAPAPPTPPPPPPPPSQTSVLPNPLNDVASSLLALFGGQKLSQTRVTPKPKETAVDMTAAPPLSPQPATPDSRRGLDLPASRDLLFQLGQQLMALAATSGGTPPAASVSPASSKSSSALPPNILPDIMLLSPPLAMQQPKPAPPTSSGFNEVNRGGTPIWMSSPSSRGPAPSPTMSASRQSGHSSGSTINTTHTTTADTSPQPPTLSGISMRGNQKYSAFYQHHRKQALNVPSQSEHSEEGFFRGQPTNSRVGGGGAGFPGGGRRCNGPSNRACGDPLGAAARFSGAADNMLLKSTVGNVRLPSQISPEGAGGGPAGLTGNLPTLSRCSRETAFLCSCGEDFDSLYIFTLHMKDTGHKPRSSQPDRDIPKLVRGQDMWINSETEQTREILRCMRCNQSFRSLPELTMHMMKTNHYSEIVYSDAGRNLLASQTLSNVGAGDASRADKGRSCTLTSAGPGSFWGAATGSGGGGKYPPGAGSYKRGGRSISTSNANGTGTALHVKAPTTGPSQQTSRSDEDLSARGIEHRPASPPQQSLPAKVFKLEHNRQLSREEEAGKGAAERDSEEAPAEPCQQRPASSHELQLKSPKPARSPDTYSCPSTLQHAEESEHKLATPSPGKENSEGESKYLTGAGCEASHSPSSSRGTTSPAQCGEGDTADTRRSQCCSDSVIRQIESFVEKSLPYPAISSPAKTNWHRNNPGIAANSLLLKGMHTAFGGSLFPRPNQSPIGVYDMPSLETTTTNSRSNLGQRKRRYSSGSSSGTTATPSGFSSHLPTTEEITSVSEKGPATTTSSQLFGATADQCNMAENSSSSASENPLSSLQKLVETTHQAASSSKSLGSPLRPSFSSFGSDKANSPSPANLSHTPTSEVDLLKLTTSTGMKPPNSQAGGGLASAISALYSYMAKVSSAMVPPRQMATPPKTTMAAPATSDIITSSSNSSGESGLFPTPDMKLLADLIALQSGGAGAGALTSDLETGATTTATNPADLTRDLPPAWLGLLTMVLNAAAKQSGLQMLSKNWSDGSSDHQAETQDKKSDIRPLGMLDVTATSAAAAAVAAMQSQFLQPFGPPTGVQSFSNMCSSGVSGFGLSSPAFQAMPGGGPRGPRGSGGPPNTPASLSLPVHMSTAASTSVAANSGNMVANITKKAKCHFCGKPFANKGQVRLHISKNKCPCLLQQSCHAAAMAKASLMRGQVASSVASSVAAAAASSSPLASNKRPPFSPLFSGGFSGTGAGLGDFSQFFNVSRTAQQQQQQQQKDLHMQPSPQQSQPTNQQQQHKNTDQGGGGNPPFTDHPMESSLPTEAAALELLLRHLQFPTQQPLLNPATSRPQQQQQQPPPPAPPQPPVSSSLSFPLPDVQALAGFKPTADLLATLARAAGTPISTTAASGGTVAASSSAFENPLGGGSNSLLSFITGQIAAAAAAAPAPPPPLPPPPPPAPAPVQSLEATLTPEQKALFLFAQAVASLSSATAAPKPTESTETTIPKNPSLPNLIQTFGLLPPAPPVCNSDAGSSSTSSLLNTPTAVPPGLDTLAGLNPDLLNSYLSAIRKIAATASSSGNGSKNTTTTSSSEVTSASINTRPSATVSQSDDTDSR